MFGVRGAEKLLVLQIDRPRGNISKETYTHLDLT